MSEMMRSRRLGALLFPGFEVLDLFGPLEMFGNLPGAIDIVTVAQTPGPVRSGQGPSALAEYGFDDCPPLDLLLIPGGMGTRTEVDNPAMIEWLRQRVPAAEVVMTVCSGTALPARAGLLDGRRATTNKMFFHEVAEQGPRVEWVREARWVEDGKFATSSGVSAGIDMALAVIAKLAGQDVSDRLAIATEYEWHRDADWDPFAKVHGLV
jgi:transcriptional regulator GlxA family with amidase domain